MKQTKVFMGALMAIMLVACSNKESLIKDYEKACADGNSVKAVKIANELDKKFTDSDFTEDEMMRIAAASAVLEGKALEGMSNILDGANDIMNLFEE